MFVRIFPIRMVSKSQVVEVVYEFLDSWVLEFIFHPYLGKIFQFDSYFSTGMKPPTRFCLFLWHGRTQVNMDKFGSQNPLLTQPESYRSARSKRT